MVGIYKFLTTQRLKSKYKFVLSSKHKVIFPTNLNVMNLTIALSHALS